MYPFVAKLGSKVTPRRPCSPAGSTERVTNGVGSREPALMTRSFSVCSHTNRRPSGAKAIAVGLAIALATKDSVNPVGSVAALTRERTASTKRNAVNRSVQLQTAKRICRRWVLSVRISTLPGAVALRVMGPPFMMVLLPFGPMIGRVQEYTQNASSPFPFLITFCETYEIKR